MKIEQIGVIGTGKFGTLLVEVLPSAFPHAQVVTFPRKDSSMLKVSQCDLVIPAVPTASFEEVIRKVAPLLKKGSIVMDVCSVKSYPVSVMKKELPSDIQIIATHPMFGPGTVAKLGNNLEGLRLVMEPVRISDSVYSEVQEAFREAGFNIVTMSAIEHDRHAAEFHFTAHVIAALVKKIELSRTPIDTRSVESLFDFVEMVQTDDLKLLKEMYLYNPFCEKQMQKINSAYQSINRLLRHT